MDNVLIFREVEKHFDKRKVLDGLSFTLKRGSMTALVGNNGSGKSTAIHVLCGLVTPERGEILFEGAPVPRGDRSHLRHMGVLLSKPHLIEELSAVEYWHTIGRLRGLDANQRRQRIDALRQLLALDEADKPVGKLSSGNQMKVKIGATLIPDPGFLVWDEPFINLDLPAIAAVEQLLRQWQGEKTLLVASHQLDLVYDLCDHFLIMDAGRIILTLEKPARYDYRDFREEIKAHLGVTRATAPAWL